MDGVLVDGEPLHFAALNELLAPEGLSLTLDAYRPYIGTKAGWTAFIADLGLAGTPEEYGARYHDLIVRQYREVCESTDGATCLVLGLAHWRIPIALASSSIRPWVDACLKRIGLDNAFDAIFTGEEVLAGKPDPGIYRLTAERLGVDPRACLAIEDSPAGIASAKAAGMTCWAVRTEYTEGLDLSAADAVFDSLRDIRVRELAKEAA